MSDIATVLREYIQVAPRQQRFFAVVPVVLLEDMARAFEPSDDKDWDLQGVELGLKALLLGHLDDIKQRKAVAGSLKSPDTLVEGVIVRTKDSETIVGEVLIYEQGGLIEIDVREAPSEEGE